MTGLDGLLLTLAEASGLAAVAWIVGRTRTRPETAHVLWVLVFVRLLVPAGIALPILPSAARADEPLTTAADRFVAPSPGAAAADMALPSTEAVGTLGGTSPAVLLGALWILGSVMLLAYFVAGALRLQRVVASSPDADEGLRARARRAAAALGIRRLPRIRVFPRGTTPALWPVPPTVLVPRDAETRYDRAGLDSMLLHEMAHVARRDHLVRWIEVAALFAYWWFVPIWWFRRCLRTAEEAACDARVVRTLDAGLGVSPGDYARALIAAASEPGTRTGAIALTGIATKTRMEERIVQIMRPTPHRPLHHPTRTALLAIAVVFPLLPTPADRGPEPSGPARPELRALATPQDPVPRVPVEPGLSEADAQAMKRLVGLLSAGKTDEAARELERHRGPEANATFDFLAGNLAMRANDAEAAAAAFGIAVGKFGNYRRAWKSLGIAHVRTGDFVLARNALHEAIRLGDRDATSYGLLGTAALESGEVADAERALWIAVTIEPETRDWRLGLIQCLHAQQRFVESMAILEGMLARSPDDVELHKALAETRKRAKGREQPESGELTPPVPPPPAARPRRLTVEMDAEGGLTVGGREVGIDAVQEIVRRLADPEATTILLRADRDTLAGALVRVVDACRSAGVTRVSIASAGRPQEPESRTPVGLTELDAAPRPISRPAPEVTTALGPHLPGRVTVLLIVGTDGRVAEAKIQDSSDEALEEPTLVAVRRWVYETGTVDGEPRPYRLRVPVTFPAR